VGSVAKPTQIRTCDPNFLEGLGMYKDKIMGDSFTMDTYFPAWACTISGVLKEGIKGFIPSKCQNWT